MECALLDLSWVGEGYGMYDLMYLLWGEFTQENVDASLGEYRAELLRRLPPGAGDDYAPEVMRRHFELCVLDLLRWWVGFEDDVA